MDLSPEDRARLDRLMEQHLNGQLSDEEYQRRSWEILRGTDSGAGSRAALRAQGTSASISQTVSDAELKSIGSAPKRKRRNRINETLIPLALVFIFGIALALVVGVLKSNTRRPLIEQMGQTQPTPSATSLPSESATLEQGDLYFQPLFGDYALSLCRKECVDTREGTARKACLRDCNHLKLTKFGRRVSVAPLDASHDARGWVAACLTKDLNIRRHSSAIGWEEEIEATAYLLNQVARSKQSAGLGGLQSMYGQVLRAVRSLRAPPGGQAREQKLSEDMTRANCLTAGSLLAQLGAETAKLGSDEFSVRYYKKFAEEVDESMRPQVDAVLEQARAMGLYSNE